MKLSEICVDDKLQWKSAYVSSYLYRIDATTVHCVLKYQIPFPLDDEKIFMERFGIPASQRKEFYQNLLRCIQHQVKASALLAQQNVPSCIRFFRVEQDRSESGVTSIYLETENIRPIAQSIFGEATDMVEAINVAARLSIILRDLQKEPHKLTLRVLDPNEIYINDENRIVLGGLFYAVSSFLPAPPAFLPTCTPNIRQDVRDGSIGDAGADMYSPACMIWNLFSGIPLDARLPDDNLVFPQYANDALAQTLLLGRSGNENDVASFRRLLGKCRAAYSKEDDLPMKISIRKQRRKEYEIQII